MKTLSGPLYRVRRRLRPGAPELFYLTDRENWVLRWVGHYVTTGVQDRFGLRAHLDRPLSWVAAGDIVHFGSLWNTAAALDSPAAQARLEGRRVVATLFHGRREDGGHFGEAIEKVLGSLTTIQSVVTASRMMAARLAGWGIPEGKVTCIPLGVDLSRFRPAASEARRRQRAALGIPDDAVCIGSFQKDGEGWGEGLSPKVMKGPDVFLAVVERLAKRHAVFVLLTGPARGYVKAGLERMGVPYRHEQLDDFLQIPRYYQCLDLYLVTAREEGGPQAILEAPACGVPVVSTRVGLAPDILEDGVSGLLREVEDAKGLADAASQVIEDAALRARLIAGGLRGSQEYDWPRIAARYYHEVYAPLLNGEHR
jgi:glycosyltransferase involved in cell wall biosynthesis